jgi:ribosomal protein S18 acetylase RimI-like enzyme
MTSPVIRLATFDDLDTVCALNRDVQSVHHEAMPERFKPPSNDPALRAHFESVLANPDCGILLALWEGAAVGYAVYEIRTSPESVFAYTSTSLFVDQISVRPEFRGRTIGGCLMEALERLARDHKAEVVQLDFWSFNQQARAFYQRRGYQACKERWLKPMR